MDNTEKITKAGHSEAKIPTWEKISNHQVLLEDRVRTLSYKKAIEASVKRKDTVLDIGCGTGILSFFAAKKKCRKVYAVEKTGIIDCARETAALNGLDNIEFIRKDIMEFKPGEKIDLLIQEQIGRYIWDDDLVRKVSHIRDNYLKRGGRLVPFKIDLYFAPINYKSKLEKCVSFWRSRRYGVDFSNIARKVYLQNIQSSLYPSELALADKKLFLCKEKAAHTIDLRKDSDIPGEIAASFRLKRGAVLTGMCCFFKVHLTEKHSFSNSPRRTNVCWPQIFLPCAEKKVMRRDSVLNFTFFPDKDELKWRYSFDIVESTAVPR